MSAVKMRLKLGRESDIFYYEIYELFKRQMAIHSSLYCFTHHYRIITHRFQSGFVLAICDSFSISVVWYFDGTIGLLPQEIIL